MKDDFKYLKIGICLVLISFLISNTIALVQHNAFMQETYNKREMLYCGEVAEITYWNITVEEYSRLSLGPMIRNTTYHFYNLTIFNILTYKIENLSLGIGVITHHNIEIGDTIIFYHLGDLFYDIVVIKEVD